MFSARYLVSLGLLALSASALPANAAVAAAAQRFFGVLADVRGTAMTLRLRDGRLLAVDAAPAFAGQRVSQPLFAGKPTVVVGAFDRRGIFHATAVSRGAPRPANWGLDR
jgi:hypothetical protein